MQRLRLPRRSRSRLDHSVTCQFRTNMLVICPIFDRCELLPFYLRYYGDLGASKFVVALWNGEKNPLYEVIKTYKDWNLEIRTSIECAVKDYNGPDESTGLNKIVAEFKDAHPWYCLADLDEFCYFGGRSLDQVVVQAEAKGHTAVHGTFYDRIARDGKFPPIRLLHSLDSTFPMACDLTRSLGANFNKVPLSRSDLLVESGHHWSKGNIWWNQCEVHHFKWSEGLIERLRERDLYFTAQGLPWSGESARFLQVIQEDEYRDDPNFCYREARKLGI